MGMVLQHKGTRSGNKTGTTPHRTKGAFSHRARSTNYYVVDPTNTPENHPPPKACMINSKQHGVQNSGPCDPWQASD